MTSPRPTRELGRFDSRPWLASLRVPAAVVVTTRDTVVLPRKQRSLASQLGARVLEAPIQHLEVVGRKFNAPLLAALEAVAGAALAGPQWGAAGTG